MNALLEWLLDLERIRLDGSQDVSLRWTGGPLTGWLVALCVVLLIAYVCAVYRREGGTRRGRVVLAVLRCALVLLVVAIIAQPVLVLQRTKTDPSYVALLVDVSSSMSRPDRYYDADEARAAAHAAGLLPPEAEGAPSAEVIEQLATGPSRFELFLSACRANNGAILKALAARNHINLYTFSNRARLAATAASEADVDAVLATLSDAKRDGTATDLAGAVQDVLKRSRGTRLAGLIVASDGASTVRGDLRAAGEAAKRRHVPVHTVLLGSSIPPRDVVVGPVFAESTVFVKDLVAVRARIATHGYTEPMKVAVSLRERGASVPLSTETITVGGETPQRAVELRLKPETGGKHRYEVSIAPRPDEVDRENNRAIVDITVVDDKLHVLYVEDEPRFEYRYLKNTLVREETMITSCLLLSADDAFPQEGNEPVSRFPESPEALYRYDVVLFGDVPLDGDWLTDSQEKMLLDFVGQRGGGFGLIAGERYAPHTYRGSAIETLLPVRLDPSADGGSGPRGVTLTSAYQPVLTAEAKTSTGGAILRFELNADESAETFAHLPGMYWLARTLGPKPGAEVLAVHPTVETLTGPAPVIVVGRYGAGRTFFQATDETWRWREYTGEGYFDAYWLGVLRYLARSKTIGRDARFELSADPSRAEYGQAVTIRLTVADAALVDRVPDRIDARVTDGEGRPVAPVVLSRLGPGSKWFEGTFVGPRRGSYVLSARPAPLDPGEKPPSVTVTIQSSSPESQRLSADHDALRQLSAMTEGGRAVRVDQLGQLADRIEDRSILVPDDIAEPLWDTRLVLALFVLIILVEWVVRKAMDLV